MIVKGPHKDRHELNLPPSGMTILASGTTNLFGGVNRVNHKFAPYF